MQAACAQLLRQTAVASVNVLTGSIAAAASCSCMQILPHNNSAETVRGVRSSTRKPRLENGKEREERHRWLEMYRQHNSMFLELEGQCVIGRVVHVTRKHVWVDVGYKQWVKFPQGTLTTGQLVDAEQDDYRESRLDIRPGDKFEFQIECVESPYGTMFLNPVRGSSDVRLLSVWDEIKRAAATQKPIMGRVLNQVNGGYAVGIGGYVAFLPYSRCSPQTVQRIGVLQPFLIYSVDEAVKNFIVFDPAFSYSPSPRRRAPLGGLRPLNPSAAPNPLRQPSPTSTES